MNTTNPPAVLAPLEAAWEGMMNRLFRPARLQVWVGLGFTAWLAHLGESGVQFDVSNQAQLLAENPGLLPGLWENYASFIIAGGVLLLMLLLALTVLFLWLRCRGTFMFLDNVLRQRCDVAEPWRRAAGCGQSLFWWSLGYGLMMTLLLLVVLAPMGFYLLTLRQGSEVFPLPIALSITVPLFLVWMLSALVIHALLTELVVPLQYRDQSTVGAAWRRLAQIWQQAPGAVLGYLGMKIVLGLLIGAVVFVGGCLTCCCLWVLLAVPVVWAVVLLPVLLWSRLFGLEFLRQFGPAWDPWTTSTPPALPPAVPATADQGSNPPTI